MIFSLPPAEQGNDRNPEFFPQKWFFAKMITAIRISVKFRYENIYRMLKSDKN